MRIVRTPIYLLVFFALVAVGTVGCDDNPVEDDDVHGHAEAHGLRLTLNGAEVYRVLEAQVSCQQEPCGISVPVGEETALLRVDFLDPDGHEIHAEDLGDDFVLGYEIADPTVASFEQHAEDGKWAFHVHGETVGTTTMQLKLMHVDHADFTTPPLTAEGAIEVRVTDA